ncbi:MAG: hypothetical protein J6Q92_02465 [Oscillospiraceae bacterium]|nr:hypothetical protein [Oscillospiraceae bacterium]
MKANYTKPLLAMEMFSLTQTIVRDCADSIPEGRVDFNDPTKCVWRLDNNVSVFVQDTCTFDGEKLGYACYNNPSEGNYIFHS